MNDYPCCKKCETNDGFPAMCMVASCPCHSQEKPIIDYVIIPPKSEPELDWKQPSAEWEKCIVSEYSKVALLDEDRLDGYRIIPAVEFIRKVIEQVREENISKIGFAVEAGRQSMYEDIYRKDIVQEIRVAALKEVVEMIKEQVEQDPDCISRSELLQSIQNLTQKGHEN